MNDGEWLSLFLFLEDYARGNVMKVTLGWHFYYFQRNIGPEPHRAVVEAFLRKTFLLFLSLLFVHKSSKTFVT